MTPMNPIGIGLRLVRSVSRRTRPSLAVCRRQAHLLVLSLRPIRYSKGGTMSSPVALRRVSAIALILLSFSVAACKSQAVEQQDIQAAATAAAEKAVAEERARVAKEEVAREAAIQREK